MRDHPDIDWPEAWVRSTGPDKFVLGEIGVLTHVDRSSYFPTVLLLQACFKNEEFIGVMVCKKDELMEVLDDILRHNIGNRIREIGDIIVPLLQ